MKIRDFREEYRNVHKFICTSQKHQGDSDENCIFRLVEAMLDEIDDLKEKINKSL